ncbi:MAG: Rpn family recombination-promoting nuclease/putative transposase [Fibrobacter sp.]|nr:Rpn family recombination-promoting nuclease/putative transposase [Fibrobacter sp.]
MTEKKNNIRRAHDPFFRWLFANVKRLRLLLGLAGKVDREVGEFLSSVNLDTLERIPDSYSEVDETGDADLAFRVNVLTGAPVLVGIMVEHKSGRDPDTINQIARYVRSVMKIHQENRVFDGLPTMAIIFYNGRENWNPLKNLEEGYPEFFHGRVLPFACSFVNMADIPDSDCLACEDVATGMGIVAMKYAFDRENLRTKLLQFKESFLKLPKNEGSLLLEKINVYLREYVDEDYLKELEMAFKSVGQKYGFVSAGDVFRKRLADARAETQQKVAEVRAETQQKIAAAQQETEADTVAAMRKKGLSDQLIAEIQSEVEALRQSRLAK